MKRMLVAFLALGILAAACGGSEENEPGAQDAAPEEAGNTIDVTMQDYAFAVEGEPTAGPLTINFSNSGEDLHHGIIGKLDEGKTLEDVQKLLDKGGGGPPPPWLDDTPIDLTVLSPGKDAGVVINAEEGTYVLLCFMPGPENKPHALHGMVQAFEVAAADGAPPSAPEPDVSLSMTEDGFEPPELSSGTSFVEVTNDADIDGEVFIVQLEEGATLDDIETWFEEGQQGPPPMTFYGGTHAFKPGESVMLGFDLEPGDYQIVATFGEGDDVRDIPTDFTIE